MKHVGPCAAKLLELFDSFDFCNHKQLQATACSIAHNRPKATLTFSWRSSE